MSMTLWIHTLQDRDMSRDSDDHTMMHDRADDLDALCERLGVSKLSSFFDMTDLDYNFTRDLEAAGEGEEGEDNDRDLDEDEGGDVDPETGYAYGIDDMQWFDAAAGLATLEALRAALLDEEIADELDFGEDERDVLLDELDDCINHLQEPAGANGRFHLAVLT